ncbi:MULTISPECIES: sulfurtransferase complex subunit TusB [Erwinia]|uniref:Protein TusB n=1 Tax=Erwinia rhapontici TaxID=55212 RepID=A0ABM7MV21_ERWRD|nr:MULTISPECIES: sulfurtransferase complex subunit TusB [Erwinia]MBP2153784.1 tRNA 2-thiouridine synthesizing protein B [Erwinia rhapontici]NKG31431.1 sulfurtransferase complex subunit TusB [Erwinia rhapontici]NNS09584.1 sulfurtransferase complex subunit TusB [Erwinia sp. JH02]TDS90910.1 tRNA 2-thiouridine synthesizing protein B [Erwinia rhapontici]BCQ33053.1 protein TusB [Erwinia rhapontici]
MLHTLMTSPFHCDLPAMLRLLAEGDDVLLLQDGVIAALEGSSALEALLNAPISVYVLQEDLDARGLAAQISTRVTTVSYTGFVTLAVRHSQQMTW